MPNAKRFGDLRRSTLSWCRRTRISASNAARGRNSPIKAYQINLQRSLIGREYQPIRGLGQPFWVCGRDRWSHFPVLTDEHLGVLAFHGQHAFAHCRGGVSLVALICRWFEKPTTCLDKEALSGTRQRNIFWIISLFIAAAKICPISRAMSKSRDIASQARTSIAHEGSSISLVHSLPRCRITIAKLAKGRATGWDTSFCSRTGAMPIEHGVGIVLPLTSTVWRPEPLAEIIRRKLMPSLEHVTWRDPTVTPTRLAISSRLIPAATNPLIFSIACGVNLTRLPLAGGLGFVIVMAAPLEVAEAIRPSIEVTAAANQAPINEKRDFHFLDNFARPALFNVSGII